MSTSVIPAQRRSESTTQPAQKPRRRKREWTPRLILAHVGVVIAAIIFATPLVYALFSALKPQYEVFATPPTLIGSEVMWSNFADVFTYGPFVTYLLNSLFVAVTGTIVTIAVSTTAGYAFARLRWRGRELVFVLFLLTLMVPQEVLVVPMFTLMQWFGWVNTYQSLIFPWAFTAFGTFLMRQFYRGIPYELEEAARLDGAGPVRTFIQVIFPLGKSAVAVLAVFSFLSFWNSYLWPLITIQDYSTLGTLPIGLTTFSSINGTRWDLQMAAAIISMVPTAILVVALQKHLVKGIATAGLGGR